MYPRDFMSFGHLGRARQQIVENSDRVSERARAGAIYCGMVNYLLGMVGIPKLIMLYLNLYVRSPAS